MRATMPFVTRRWAFFLCLLCSFLLIRGNQLEEENVDEGMSINSTGDQQQQGDAAEEDESMAQLAAYLFGTKRTLHFFFIRGISF